MVLPEAFISRTKAVLGVDWDNFERALDEESPTTIRLNPAKTQILPSSVEELCESPVSWASNAFYLQSRPSFTLDPLFHAGCYYVQEASSMYLESIIQEYVKEPAKCLDLCAAPGGKSTQLLSVLPQGSLLVANEVIRSRSHILSENVIKWGNPHSIVTNNDPATLGKLIHYFDVLVTDVPCSGEGMFRKDPVAISEWSVNNVKLCAERQRRIIADIWPALKPGGLLVYSTCTYNKEENEENIAWICQELGGEILGEPHRFLPHQTKGEGFFIAAIRKNENKGSQDYSDRTNRGNKKDRRSNDKKAGSKIPPELNSWLNDSEQFIIEADNNNYIGIASQHIESYRDIKNIYNLKIVSAGILLAEIKGKDLIPEHALAMSTCLSKTIFPTLELDKNAALQYLKKESLQNLPPDLPKGYVLITYQGHPLGFIKNIGNRANNLYPQEWRIRMAIPSSPLTD